MIHKTAFLLCSIIILCSIHLISAGESEAVEFKRAGDQIEVLIGGKAFGTYYFGPEAPKPYFSPLRSAEGTILTRQWPMVKNVPGESHDHPHHRAMFFAHGDINGIDFWGEGQPAKSQQRAHGKFYSSENLPKGRTVFVELKRMETGKDSGTIEADFNLVGPDAKAIGSETQSYTFRGDNSTRLIDCEFMIRADHGVPLKFGDTKEGTFAIRVAKALEDPSLRMLNSEGKVGEKEIWGKRADWVDYSGKVGDEQVGIAIFDNPKNLRHPTTWHARGYGLFAVNPFGLHDFYHDLQKDGSYTIPGGRSLTLRYRVLIHHRASTAAQLAEAYKLYASGK